MSAVLGFKIISLQPTPILRNKVSWPAAASMTALSMIRMNGLTANDAATAAPPSTHVCIQSGPHLNAGSAASVLTPPEWSLGSAPPVAAIRCHCYPVSAGCPRPLWLMQ